MSERARPSFTTRPDLLRGLVSRRAALIGMGGAGLAALLAACGGSGNDAAQSSDYVDMSDVEKVVNWSNWPEYIDVTDDGLTSPTLQEFTRTTGITAHYTEDYYDNEGFFTKVQPQLAVGQDCGRDTWCATDWMVARLKRLGYLQELDKDNIPNAKNLESSLENVEFDPGRTYSLPWQSGFTGIGYNPKSTGGKAVESVDQLLTDPSLKGKVTLLTELQDTMGLVMLDMGIDPAKFSDADFDRALARIAQAKASGQLKGFTGNDYTAGLLSGEIAACFAYTGDVVQLQVEDPNLGYALPKKGHVIWSDNFVIPIRARHKKNAERLINFYYEPRVMAAVEDWVNYISPVHGSRQVLIKSDPDIAKNILIFPTRDVMARAHVFRGLTAAEEARYTKDFQQVTGG